VGLWLDIIEDKTSDCLAVYKEKFYAGKTAVSKNTYGSGQVLYIGVMKNGQLIKDILRDVFKEIGLNHMELPEGVFITERFNDKNCYTFIINMDKEQKLVNVENPGVDLISKKYVSGETLVNGMDLLIVKSH
jgi:beta-galactosidase